MMGCTLRSLGDGHLERDRLLPTIIWEAHDPLGNLVRLEQEAWDHVLRDHPERAFLAGHEEQARRTVEDPDVVTREADGSINYYRKGAMQRYPSLYLHIVVRERSQGARTVETAWPSRVIDPPEEYLWIRGMKPS